MLSQTLYLLPGVCVGVPPWAKMDQRISPGLFPPCANTLQDKPWQWTLQRDMWKDGRWTQRRWVQINHFFVINYLYWDWEWQFCSHNQHKALHNVEIRRIWFFVCERQRYRISNAALKNAQNLSIGTAKMGRNSYSVISVSHNRNMLLKIYILQSFSFHKGWALSWQQNVVEFCSNLATILLVTFQSHMHRTVTVTVFTYCSVTNNGYATLLSFRQCHSQME